MKFLWEPSNSLLWHNEKYFEKILSELGSEIDSIVEKIVCSNVQVVGFSIIYFNLMVSLEIAKRLKRTAPNIKVVFGGPETATHDAGIYFPKNFFATVNAKQRYGLNIADAFVIGDGEESLRDIVLRIRNRQGLECIPGVAANIHDSFSIFKPRPLVRDLDRMPFPDFEEFNITRYAPGKLPVIMSRGCIARCSFCNNHLLNPVFRYRSAKHVFQEMIHHIRRYDVREFFLCDQLINGNMTELDKLCDLIIMSGERISWYGSARIRKEMTPCFLKKMKKAGCTGITYGVESFSKKVLELMNKQTPLQTIFDVLKSTKEAKILTFINILIGFPGEGEEEFEETLQGIRKCKNLIDGVTYAGPCFILYGTDLHDAPWKYGIDNRYGIDSIRWATSDRSNTHEIRSRRVRRFVDCLQELGIESNFILTEEAE